MIDKAMSKTLELLVEIPRSFMNLRKSLISLIFITSKLMLVQMIVMKNTLENFITNAINLDGRKEGRAKLLLILLKNKRKVLAKVLRYSPLKPF